MAGLIRKILSSKLSWIPVGLSLVWVGYKALGPTRYPVDVLLTDLADRVIERVIVDIPRQEGADRLAVLNLKGDRNGYVADALRRGISLTGKYEVVSKSISDKLAGEFNWKTSDASTLEEAMARGRKIGCDAVVFGEIGRFAQDKDGAKVEMIIRAADVKKEAAFFIKDYSDGVARSGTSFRYLQSRMKGMSFGSKLLIWLLFTIFLPIATFFIPKSIFRKDSNFLNFAILLAYTLADFLFAFILAGFRVSGFWNALLLIFVLVSGALYNYMALSKIEEYS